MKINKTILIGIILLIGSFTYLFEMGYHGFVHQDFSKVQIILTFIVLFLSSVFILGYEYFENKNREDIKHGFYFFIATMILLFIIFYTRNMGSTIPVAFSLMYFMFSIFIFIKKDAISYISNFINSQSFFLRFSFRFFIIMGLLIFPAGVIEYARSGVFDYTLKEIYLPLISILAYVSKGILSLLGYSVHSIEQTGGYTLAMSDNTFHVFIGALCSGVTSMSVFIAAFFAIIGDIKTTLKNKVALFIFGVAGTFFSNVLRIVLLFLIGLKLGNNALMSAHTHLGWIFFFIWISLFWTILFRFSGDEENKPGFNSARQSKTGRERKNNEEPNRSELRGINAKNKNSTAATKGALNIGRNKKARVRPLHQYAHHHANPTLIKKEESNVIKRILDPKRNLNRRKYAY
ncbi:MAG: hypothetical protein DRN66_03865 [Candidatus Nanohalarchaeota archaeon]|nr:MAG: hypothetical protein DRN66_03865 [Candidatus Nanohaloarchaeota archaeon]